MSTKAAVAVMGIPLVEQGAAPVVPVRTLEGPSAIHVAGVILAVESATGASDALVLQQTTRGPTLVQP